MSKLDKDSVNFGSFKIPTLKKGNTTVYVIGVQSFSRYLGPTFVQEFLSKVDVDSIVLGFPSDRASELDKLDDNAVREISSRSSQEIRSSTFQSVYKPTKDFRTALYRYLEQLSETSLTQAAQRTKYDHLRAAHRFANYNHIPVIHGMRPQQIALQRVAKDSFSTLEVVDMCLKHALHQPIPFEQYKSIHKVMIDEEAMLLSSKVFQQMDQYQNEENNGSDRSILVVARREMVPQLLQYLEDPDSIGDVDSLLETESVDWLQVLLLYLAALLSILAAMRAIYKAMKCSREKYMGEVSKDWPSTTGTITEPLRFDPSLSSLSLEDAQIPPSIKYSLKYRYQPKDSDMPFSGSRIQIDGNRIWRSALEDRNQMRELKQMEKDYVKGKKLQVYYHPSNHNQSLIKPSIQSEHISALRRQATRAGVTSASLATFARFIL